MDRKQWILLIIGIILVGVFIGWQISRYQPPAEPREIIYDVYVGTVEQATCRLAIDSTVLFTTGNGTLEFDSTYEICSAMELHIGELATILVERDRNLIVSWQLLTSEPQI